MKKSHSIVLIIAVGSMFVGIETATAQEPLLGEVRMFAGNFAPRGWAKCDGQILPISENQALFSLLGTMYGGDGRTTFGLPDLRGRVPMHAGTGPGLSEKRPGQRSGREKTSVRATKTVAKAAPGGATEQVAGEQEVEVAQPHTVIHFIIAIQGTYPSRN